MEPYGKSVTMNAAAQTGTQQPEKKMRDEHAPLPPGAPKLRPPSRQIPKNVLHLEQKNGYLEMSSAVIEKIIHEEIGGIEEVAGFDGKPHGLSGWLSRGQSIPGLDLHIDGTSVSIDMTISVRYGRNIPAVADTIRRVLAEKIHHMTGCTLSHVNIVVDRIEQHSNGEIHGQGSF